MSDSNGESFDSVDFESFLGDYSTEPLAGTQTISGEAGSSDDMVWESSEDPPSVDDTPVGDGQCVICGAPTFRPEGLTAKGYRKRVPKFCDLHQPPKDRPKQRDTYDFAGASLEGELRKVQQNLEDEIAVLATSTALFFPVTGYYMLDNAEIFTTAFLQMCRNKPRMIRMAQKVATALPLYNVAKYGAGVAASLQVDQKRIDPHSSMCHSLGVDRAYDAIHQASSSHSGYPSTNGNQPGPPQYSTLR